ncbi:MAG: EAL domain-containing protein [Pseudomonadota bacterium]
MDQRENAHETLTMVSDALRDGRVTLALQPVVMAEGDRRPAFYEGLIRLIDRTGRAVPAARFIDTVESHDLGREIDREALRLGIAELHADPAMRLSVNLSPRSIGCPAWMEVLEQGLEQDPTLGERLILEITERSAMEIPAEVQAFMATLQLRGIAFALDDFGAGQTSFRHLRDFAFDIVKIDGQFSREIASDPDNQALIRALVDLSRHFEMFTVAEHVASAEDADSLAELGIDCLQGYHFGAPTLSTLPAPVPDLARA